MSWEEIFSPGLRHWKEHQDLEADKITEAPAPGPGPDQTLVDLDEGVVWIVEPADGSGDEEAPA